MTGSSGVLSWGKIRKNTFHYVNSVRTGGRAPAHATALGKVLLADLSDEEIRRRYVGRRLTRHTAHTVVSLAGLTRALHQVRQDGHACDDEEFIEGICCIAAPIREYTGRTVAAISISGPAFRFDPAGSQDLRSALAQATAEIGRGFEGRSSSGHRGTHD